MSVQHISGDKNMKTYNYLKICFLVISISWIGCQRNGADVSGMILVPSGRFSMGSGWKYSNPDQKPLREIYLDAYYIDKYEVTNADFHKFVEAGGYKKREYWSDAGWQFIQGYKDFLIRRAELYGVDEQSLREIQVLPVAFQRIHFNRNKEPVTGISWYEAAAYAKWVDRRLPTAAEWEKAATGMEKLEYPWGNTFDWSNLFLPTASGHRIHLVGSYPNDMSPYGVMDMAGNVREWVADWYAESYDTVSVPKNPTGPTNGTKKEVRGGFWGANRRQYRCSYRFSALPEERLLSIGFRCARSAP